MGIDSPFGNMMAQVFGSFDMACFQFFGSIQNDIFTFFANLFSACGNTIFWVLMCAFGLILIFFKRTRKVGFVILVSVVMMAIASKYLLNPWMARLRPYNALQGNAQYFSWYLSAGAIPESEFSCPSKHAAAAFAVATALFPIIRFEMHKRRAYILFIIAAIISLSRVYLMVHYMTDIIIGAICGVVFGLLTLLLYELIMMFVIKSPKLSLNLETKWDLERKIKLKHAPIVTALAVPLAIVLVSFVYQTWGNNGGFHKCEYNGKDYICCNKAGKAKYFNDDTQEYEYRCDLHNQ